MIVTDCIRAYILSRQASNCRPATIKAYKQTFNSFAVYLDSIPLTEMDNLTCDHVRQYLSQMFDKGLRDTTVKRDRDRLVGWLTWLVDEGYIDDNRWQRRIQPIKCDKKDIRFLNWEECECIINIAKNRKSRDIASHLRDIAIILLLIDTGLREAELLSLRVNDIDLVERSIYVPNTSKGRKGRTVWFRSEALKAIRAYMKARGQWETRGKTNADKITKALPWLFLSRSKKKLGVTRLWTIVKSITSEAGLHDVSVHTFRHTCATLLLLNGMPLPYVQQFLGHSDIRMTERYLHLLPNDIQAQYIYANPNAA